jgi:signal transduction histidine kinase
VRQFSRGLKQLLQHYLSTPISLAETALRGRNLSPEVSGWFQDIIDSCRQTTRLSTALEDLAITSPGETQVVPMASLVREFLDTAVKSGGENEVELSVDLRDVETPIRINRRHFGVVLEHLFRNARQALLGGSRRQIEVRVEAREKVLRCSIHDSGEGLPAGQWARFLTPFFSTKGVFAHDPAHAAQEAIGLGLTVSQHLLALHQGHLELRSQPGQGATATIILPRADVASTEPTSTSSAAPDLARMDLATQSTGPHATIVLPAKG